MSDHNEFGHENSQNENTGSQNGWTYYNQAQRPAGDGPKDANQYSANGGWQHSPRQREDYHAAGEGYQWNYDDYDIPRRGGRKKNKGLVVFVSLISLVLVFGVVSFAGYGIYTTLSGFAEDNAATASQPDENNVISSPGLSIDDKPQVSTSENADGTLTTQEIARKVRPSVVGVVVYNTSVNRFSPASEGSGIVMSSDGYIVTNAHVVENASAIKVILDNGEEYEAQLVGSDPKTDLAVIRINANNLVPAQFGNSDQVEVGERAIAIGNPGGMQLANTLTQGVISAMNRPVNSSVGYTMHCIQHDAAISPGNSGGALVNEFGQVIGINSIKIAATEYEGIGFAIPINEAKPIIDQLIEFGYVRGRVKLGVTVTEIDAMLSRLNNVPMGLYIENIDPNSDLARQGAQRGDIITRVDGKDITGMEDLIVTLQGHKPGDKVELTIYRRSYYSQQDQTYDLTVELMEDTGTSTQQPRQQADNTQS